MTKRKWTTERKWAPSRAESKFEELLAANGFKVLGIREYQSKTDYLIEKDGIQQEYGFFHWEGANAKDNYACFEVFYKTKVEYEQMKAKVSV